MKFIQSGNRLTLVDRGSVGTQTLPAATYLVKLDKLHGMFYLETMPDFTPPEKTYGDVHKIVERILCVYSERKGSTGVGLHGEKGSGKTLVAKMLSVRLIEKGIPTLIVNQKFDGDFAPLFNQFMQDLSVPCVVLFDEFEKLYEKNQEVLLSLLDGVFATKNLFILTSNNRHAINEFMQNRPSRLYYNIDFRSLDESVVEEYCRANIENTEYIAGLKNLAKMIESFNFDMLQCLVEEMNRFDETALEAVKYLNVQPHSMTNQDYEVELKSKKGKKLNWVLETTSGNALTSSFYIDYRDSNDVSGTEEFEPESIKAMNHQTGVYVYEKADWILTLRTVRYDAWNSVRRLIVGYN